MNAQVEISNIKIQSVDDYFYLEQKVKDYHDSVVSALLDLGRRNPQKYNLSVFTIYCDSDFVWIEGINTTLVTTHHILGLYLGQNACLAKLEQDDHKKEIAAFKRKLKKNEIIWHKWE